MKTVSDIRRERLRALIAEVAEGNDAAFGRLFGRDRRQVNAWTRDPGKPGAKPVSDAIAREIEQRFGKPRGWMDTVKGEPAPSQAVTLDPGIMSESEGMVRNAELLRGGPFKLNERGEELVKFYELLVRKAPPSVLYDAFESSVRRGDGAGEFENGARRARK